MKYYSQSTTLGIYPNYPILWYRVYLTMMRAPTASLYPLNTVFGIIHYLSLLKKCEPAGNKTPSENNQIRNR